MANLGETLQMPGNAQKEAGFQVNPTLWGYVLQSEMRRDAPHAGVALARKVLGGVLIMAALGLWLLPNAIIGPDVAAMKLGLTILYLALGFRLAYMPREVMRREVQVNLTRAELRVGFRNKAGGFSLQAVHSFDDIDAVTLWQSDCGNKKASLFLRLGGSDVALVAASGTPAQLQPLKQRLAKDLGTMAGGFNPVSVAAGRKAKPLLLGPRIEAAGAAA